MKAFLSAHGVRAVCLLGALVLLSLGTGFDLDPFDSAELALVSVRAGLGHPPGQPLHTVLGWLLTRLPFAPLTLLALLSLVPFAVMASFVTDALPAPNTQRASTASVCSIVLVAWALCALEPVRQSVCRVEVYALAALCAVMAVRFAHRGHARDDLWTGLCLGLAASTNPVLAMQGVGAVAFWLPRQSRVRALARITLGGVLGLALYVYPFLVASRGNRTLVWGAPHSLHDLLAILSARDFQGNVKPTLGVFLSNVGALVRDHVRSGMLVWIAAGLVAWWFTAFEKRVRVQWIIAVCVSLGFGLTMLALNVPYRGNNPDYGGYLLVPLSLSAMGIAHAAVHIARERVQWTLAALSLMALCACRFTGSPAPQRVTRSLARTVLESAPLHGWIVLSSDHLLFPVLYLQDVEGVRRDVLVLNTGWASASWAWRRAQAQTSDLHVDLQPGLGGLPRLIAALRARPSSVAVMSETPDLLVRIAPGEVCPRGVLWSTSQGCSDAREHTERAQSWMLTASRTLDNETWDARMIAYTSRAMGDGAARLGCLALALRWYRAAQGQEYTEHGFCGRGPVVSPLAAPGIMEISRRDVMQAQQQVESVFR